MRLRTAHFRGRGSTTPAHPVDGALPAVSDGAGLWTVAQRLSATRNDRTWSVRVSPTLTSALTRACESVANLTRAGDACRNRGGSSRSPWARGTWWLTRSWVGG